MAEALNNVRQVKFALDGFASDHNGRFPDDAFHDQFGTSGASSNALFRQLFVAEETASEMIFWVKTSPVASSAPPDNDAERGLDHILQRGENHWAYAHGLTAHSRPETPLVFDPHHPDTGGFDPDPWDLMAVILRVDGSARAMRMRISDNRVLDEAGNDLFSPEAPHWNGSLPDLRQPESVD